jgi:4-hydroxybenzoate polyprenyltransferase
LLAAATAVAWFLPPAFRVVLGCYYCLTLAYSLNLKRLVIIDTTVLAALYTLRVIAGAAASQIALSFWLLLFSAFFFLSLAFVKRYAELESVQRRHEVRAPGRGYDVSDLPMLEGLGIAAGYMSVLVMALYINSPAVAALYHNPQLIWPLCALLLYWMSRIWMKTHRGRMHDDPVIFALRDRVSIALGSLCAACVYAAI